MVPPACYHDVSTALPNHYAPPRHNVWFILTLTQVSEWLTLTVPVCRSGKEATMASRDKRGKEKRKPKKDKLAVGKPREGSEIIEHVQHHGQTPADKNQ
jgi:hypothetical protein